MSTRNSDYRQLIETLLGEYADFLGQDEAIEQELVFDYQRDRYLLVETGWQNHKRIYGSFIHIDIKDGKVWIQHDGTEDGIAHELVSAGIPKDKIVLGYKSIKRRRLTEYAVS